MESVRSGWRGSTCLAVHPCPPADSGSCGQEETPPLCAEEPAEQVLGLINGVRWDYCHIFPHFREMFLTELLRASPQLQEVATLMLTEEERRLLEKEGLTLPETLPLTKVRSQDWGEVGAGWGRGS